MQKYEKLLSILIAILFFAFASRADSKPRSSEVAGEYIVQLHDSAKYFSRSEAQDFAAQLETQFQGFLSFDKKLLLLKTSLLKRSESVLETLGNHPLVALAEPNYIYKVAKLPNDNLLGELWGLKNKHKHLGGLDIEAEKAWDMTTGSRDVVVAVIDSGVNYNHPDLVNNMWTNPLEANGQAGVDDDGNGYVDDIHGYDFANNDGDPMDDLGHGTHCAGTIGAEGNNGKGVVGVNWQVSLMALKFISSAGEGDSAHALQAIDYATQMGVDVMNNSWGGGDESELMRQAIKRAEKAGILFVAAAGNSQNNNDRNPFYPASYKLPNIISVAAARGSGDLVIFSNYGQNSVHIAAPGVSILSTYNNGYATLDGTSMAAPHVAGVAALLLANEPQMTHLDLKERMLKTSHRVPSLEPWISHGLLNANNALRNDVQ